MPELQTTSTGIQYKIEGDVYPVLTVYLKEKNEVYSEAGAMSWMTANAKMKASIKGVAKIFSRFLTKEKLFVTKFSSNDDQVSEVSFTTSLPGKIIAITLEEGQSFYCQKDTFLCAEPGVELKATLAQHFMGAIFGGEGVILMRLTGKGTFFIEIDGEIKDFVMAEGEVLNIDEGNLACWDSKVDYTAKLTKGGPMNWLFGGEGLFMGRAKGPGRILLQTLPAKKLANHLVSLALKKKRGGSKGKGLLSLTNLNR